VKRVADNPFPSQKNPDTEPAAIQAYEASEDLKEGEYRVESILQYRRKGRGWQVLVKWVGWAEPTWEPLRDLEDTAALDQYETTLQTIPWRREGEAIVTG